MYLNVVLFFIEFFFLTGTLRIFFLTISVPELIWKVLTPTARLITFSTCSLCSLIILYYL